MQPSICFTSIAAYPLFSSDINVAHGGAEVEAYYLANEFRNRDYRVEFVVGDFGQNKLEAHNQIRVWSSIPIKESNLFQGIINTFRLIKIWKKANSDIYFTKGAGFLTFQLALFCKLFRKRFIFKTSHKHNIDLSLRKKPYHFFYRWALGQANHVVVQNQEDIEIIKKNYNINAVVIKNYQPMPRKEEILEYEDRQYILWVGRIAKIKRPEIFIKIAKDLPKINFLIIASVSDQQLWKQIKRQAAEVKNLKIKKDIPHSKIDSYYRRASFFVSTSSGEGFPNTFIEAMKWGTPLASHQINPDNFIYQAKVGIFANNNYDTLVDKIVDTLNNKNDWTTYSKNSQLYARNEFGLLNISKWEQLIMS